MDKSCRHFPTKYAVKAGVWMICITGDIHGEYARFEHKKLKSLKEGDCLIVCGDFGFLWNDSPQERAMLKKISERRYRILFVDGTHENFALLKRYPVSELYGGRVQKITDHIIHLLRGEIYTIEGHTFFTFGGGDSTDKDFRLDNGTWYCEEQPSPAEMAYAVRNLAAAGRQVDYIVTHQPAMKERALVEGMAPRTPLSDFLDELSHDIRYERWYFGSLHKNKRLPHAHSLFTDIVTVGK